MYQTYTVDLGETSIHYAEAPGPALLILHGITGALDSFAPLIPTLAQQSHVYALDLRGHKTCRGARQAPIRWRIMGVMWRPFCSARFAAHASHGTQTVIDAGHVIHRERPAEYVQAVQKFVAQVGVESY